MRDDLLQLRTPFGLPAHVKPLDAQALGLPVPKLKHLRPIQDEATSFTGFDTFSQEFRLTSGPDAPFNWVAGLYYFNEKVTREERFLVGTALPIAPPNLSSGLLWRRFDGDLYWSLRNGKGSKGNTSSAKRYASSRCG